MNSATASEKVVGTLMNRIDALMGDLPEENFEKILVPLVKNSASLIDQAGFCLLVYRKCRNRFLFHLKLNSLKPKKMEI